jgi:hypothetical protein
MWEEKYDSCRVPNTIREMKLPLYLRGDEGDIGDKKKESY